MKLRRSFAGCETFAPERKPPTKRKERNQNERAIYKILYPVVWREQRSPKNVLGKLNLFIK